MKTLNLKLTLMAIFCYVSITSYSYAQQGTVTINQDKNIDVLLNLKKEINKTDTDYYKIQIYSGSHRSEAEDIQSKFNSTFSKWDSKILYEYPNFKIWAGSFSTRLEADRAFRDIKTKFPNALILKPKKSIKK